MTLQMFSLSRNVLTNQGKINGLNEEYSRIKA